MDILYRYCSTASFHAITQSHALWLSSLSLSNDTMEGKLITRTITHLADKDLLDSEDIRLILKGNEFIEKLFDGLGFCFSEKGDLLSQWRGYAGDATGVAIGFSVNYLRWLSTANRSSENPGFSLEQVKYKPSEHEACIEPAYRKIVQLIQEGTQASGVNSFRNIILSTEMETAYRKMLLKVYSELLHSGLQLFCLKSSAFEEEHEWRLLAYRLRDRESKCLHHVMGNRIVLYRKIELVELERHPITEVILGPKHGTPPEIVENFLKLNHYDLVKVKRSEVSYR